MNHFPRVFSHLEHVISCEKMLLCLFAHKNKALHNLNELNIRVVHNVEAKEMFYVVEKCLHCLHTPSSE